MRPFSSALPSVRKWFASFQRQHRRIRNASFEAKLNTFHLCPDCLSPKFIIGPSGGMAVNIKCAGCGSTFWFAPPFTPERIPPVEGVYVRGPVDLREWLDPPVTGQK